MAAMLALPISLCQAPASPVTRDTSAAISAPSSLQSLPFFGRRVPLALSQHSAQPGARDILRVHARVWKSRDTRNIDGRSKALLHKLKNSSGTREETVATLDAWAAFQQDFPLLATKRAIQELKAKGDWTTLVQVCKWMLQKGHGRTFGTYSALLEATARLERDMEMDRLWDLILEEGRESVPRKVFAEAMQLFTERSRPLKVLELYGSMDALKIRLDQITLTLVLDALEAVGAPNHAAELAEEYRSVRLEWRYSDGVRKQVKSYGRSTGGEFSVPNRS